MEAVFKFAQQQKQVIRTDMVTNKTHFSSLFINKEKTSFTWEISEFFLLLVKSVILLTT